MKMKKMQVARLGGLARIKLHGNPGTSEGRRLGGLRSIVTHNKQDSKFNTLKNVRMPRHSAKLAELMGILMGDGHLDTYQVSVTTNSETDAEHAQFIVALFTSIFGITPSVKKRREKKVLNVTLSSKMACAHLRSLGMPQGNKLAKGLRPPEWILKRKAYSSAFLRGLIDTDGCVYEDKHIVKGKQYSSICIAFTSASPELLDSVESLLVERGFSSTRWGRHIRLRRKKDVLRYAKEIGFSNPKHAGKIRV